MERVIKEKKDYSKRYIIIGIISIVLFIYGVSQIIELHNIESRCYQFDSFDAKLLCTRISTINKNIYMLRGLFSLAISFLCLMYNNYHIKLDNKISKIEYELAHGIYYDNPDGTIDYVKNTVEYLKYDLEEIKEELHKTNKTTMHRRNKLQ